MLHVVLIEDERIALRKLKNLLLQIAPQIQIVAELESVEEANIWFQQQENKRIDLIFSDIQLSDGLSFEIFEQLPHFIPVIFTTAYDAYSLKAFKQNGIDYLLKPLQTTEVAAALNKYAASQQHYSQTQLLQLKQQLMPPTAPATVQFLVHFRHQIIPLAANDISCFFTKNQLVYAQHQQIAYVIDQTLDDIQQQLPAACFFRANRQFIIHQHHIQHLTPGINGKLHVRIQHFSESIVISREKAPAFKLWLQGKKLTGTLNTIN